tara:strand:- start:375965 stop:376306 length:342 start_codon:yes stop_codon:yes gene_type:complete
MAWLSNRKFKALTDRAEKRFAAELEDEAKSKTLALALGHACYRSGTYGDRGTMDSMLQTIRSVATTPCDPSTALMLVKQWESGTLDANEIIGRVWGMEIDPFVARIVKRIKVG